ncbi:hypothetical protein G6F35_014455 [Rhizopus arrhizus]|nr:hypothetical protein G6F35_014455 [Rhizopus arrhizus]
MKCLLALLLLIPLAVECYKALSTESLKHLAQLTDAQKLSVNGELMKPLLVERISGTPENEQVQKHIISHFERLGWHIELDRFTDSTPFGTKNFTNIIPILNLLEQRTVRSLVDY